MSSDNNNNFNMSLDELERHLWEAAHIITGPIDAPDYKTYIFPVLFFKRICDVYDEEYHQALIEYSGDQHMALAPEQHRIQIPEGCHWENVITVPRDVGKALKAAFLCIEKANDHLYKIFGDAAWTNKDRLPDHLLLSLLNHFNKVNLGVRNVRDDNMGRAQNTLSIAQADQIFAIYKKQHQSPFEDEGVSRWVDYDELKENDFNLNIARYVHFLLFLNNLLQVS